MKIIFNKLVGFVLQPYDDVDVRKRCQYKKAKREKKEVPLFLKAI